MTKHILDVEAAKIATGGRVTLEKEDKAAREAQDSLDAGVNEAMEEAWDKLGPTTPIIPATPTKSE